MDVDVAVDVAVGVGVGVAITVVVTISVVGSMSIIDIVRVVGLPGTVTVFVIGGGDSMMVVGADVTVTVRVTSASPPCPPLPSMGTTEYVGRAASATGSAVGVLLHIKGRANDELHKEETARSREIGIFWRCIMPGIAPRPLKERERGLLHLLCLTLKGMAQINLTVDLQLKKWSREMICKTRKREETMHLPLGRPWFYWGST